MLFHVRLRHDAAHCPGYQPDLLPKWVEGITKRHEIAAQLGVTLHGNYSALPEHQEFIIVEADSTAQIAALVLQLYPSEQAEIEVTALTTADEMLELARQIGG